jgi:hypothetical protein
VEYDFGEGDMSATFSIASSGATAYLNQPNSLEYMKTKRLKRLYFWSSSTVYDAGPNSISIVLRGRESTASGTDDMTKITGMCDGGYLVTIGGLDHSDLNTNYIIKDFIFDEAGGNYQVYSWSLMLERV